jgi:hypothetical protein
MSNGSQGPGPDAIPGAAQGAWRDGQEHFSICGHSQLKLWFGYDCGWHQRHDARLSEPERKQVADWLEELDEEAWDREMKRILLPAAAAFTYLRK